MTKQQGKFLFYMGIAITILASYIITLDFIVGGIGFLLGLWNIIKGYRVMKGKQPLLIRMQEKRYEEEKDLDPFNPEHREKYNNKDKNTD